MGEVSQEAVFPAVSGDGSPLTPRKKEVRCLAVSPEEDSEAVS